MRTLWLNPLRKFATLKYQGQNEAWRMAVHEPHQSIRLVFSKNHQSLLCKERSIYARRNRPNLFLHSRYILFDSCKRFTLFDIDELERISSFSYTPAWKSLFNIISLDSEIRCILQDWDKFYSVLLSGKLGHLWFTKVSRWTLNSISSSLQQFDAFITGPSRDLHMQHVLSGRYCTTRGSTVSKIARNFMKLLNIILECTTTFTYSIFDFHF